VGGVSSQGILCSHALKFFLEFKNIIFEKKLSNTNTKIVHFSGVRFWDFLLEYPKTTKFSDLQGSFT
jgi:hypothetical protein